VFAAWVNHVDAKGKNTLDALIKEDGRAFIRHYLQDFGSALGSAAIGPHEAWEGSEYLAEPGHAFKQALAFGFLFPRWHTADFYESRSVGRLPEDNERFDPEQWKPRVPNPAFERARADDKFWAARKLVAMTDDLLRAAVKTGEFGDQRSEDFLVTALGERREAIARAYLTTINPIANPAIDSNMLTFENVAVARGFSAAPAAYRVAWFTFDNTTRESRAITETSQPGARVPLPPGLSTTSGVYIKVELSATGGPHPSWEKPVHAYFRRQDTAWQLVGFERLPEM
jgi:hypothetical protein